jgi:hypothetical protein
MLLLAAASGCPAPSATVCGDVICPGACGAAANTCAPLTGGDDDGDGDGGPSADSGVDCDGPLAGDELACTSSEWREMHPPTVGKLVGLWVAARDDVFVLAETGEVLEWNGHAWTQVVDAVSSGNATGIWGDATGTLYVSVNNNTVVSSPDWEPESIGGGSPAGFQAIAGAGDTVVAVGTSNLIATRGGGSWARDTFSQAPAINLLAVARSATHTIAVGDHAGIYFDGMHTSGGLAGVEVPGVTLRAVAIGAHVYIAGESVDASSLVTILRLDAGTGAVTKEPMDTESVDTIYGLWASGEDGFAAGGQSVVRRVAGVWTDEPNVPVHSYLAVAASTTDVFVVGQSGAMIRRAL